MTYFLGEYFGERHCASRGDLLLRARSLGASYQQVSTDGQGCVRVLLRTGRYGSAVGGGWFISRARADAFCRMARVFVGDAQ